MIPYEDLGQTNREHIEELKAAFARFVESGWYILGTEVSEFEKEFAHYTGSRYCVGVASGLDALHLSLKSLGIPAGKEVIVPSNTYIATILAIVNNGLKPILVEPDIDSYNIDPARIESQISHKTAALMVVHLYGKSCDMDSIMAIANKHQLPVVEDCAQSHGAKYKGRQTGTFGSYGAFSFYPTKNLGALGDAGALCMHGEAQESKIKALRNYGSHQKYVNKYLGLNSRLDEVQAAFLRIKLRKLDKLIEHKRALAKLYQQELKDDFIKPKVHKDYHDVYHIYNIRHPERDKIRGYLQNNGVRTEIHYPIPAHKQEAMQGIIEGHCPVSEEIHATTLSLPISYGHSKDDISRVIELLNKY